MEERFVLAPIRLGVETGSNPGRYTQNARELASYSRPSNPIHIHIFKTVSLLWDTVLNNAEKEGFEPSRAVKPCLVSSEVLSASQSPLHLNFLGGASIKKLNFESARVSFETRQMLTSSHLTLSATSP